MQSLAQTLEGLLYRLIAPLLLCRSKTPQKQEALSTSQMSNEEIDKLAEWAPMVDKGAYIDQLSGKPSFGNIAKIAPDAVAKWSHLSCTQELISGEFVRTYTAIPIPMPERAFRVPLNCYLVQQFIPGRALLDVWPHLSWWMRFRVALTLRFYVHELRCISSRAGPPLFPGPLSDDGKPRECIGRLFTNPGAGPFNSYREMSKWYQNRFLLMKELRKDTPDSAPFDDSAPLVFTHQDLHPRNIILGEDGQLWIVDWSDAGWYPSWFESASMTMFTRGHRDTPSSWTACIPFIAGSCNKPGQLPFIRAIAYSLEVLMPDLTNMMDPSEQVTEMSE